MSASKSENHPAVETMRRDGVVRVPCFLEPTEVAVLQRRASELLCLPSIPFAEYHARYRHRDEFGLRVYADRDWTIVNDLLGTHADLDEVFERVLTNTSVRAVLTAVLGSGYKLWDANLRRHEPGSKGQDLHQDGLGGVGLAVLVSDHPDRSGSTVFLPRSHRLPIRYGDFGVALRPTILRPALVAADGRPGDVVMWFTRTWHGRHPGPDARTSLLASFWGRGASYRIHSAPRDVLDRLPAEVRRVMDPEIGVTVRHGLAQVCGEPGGREPDPDLSHYAFSRQKPGKLSPWRVVRAAATARSTLIDAIGREKLRALRATVLRTRR